MGARADTSGRYPVPSPAKSTPVDLPSPNLSRLERRRVAPKARPILTAPTLDDFVTISVRDHRTAPRGWDSWIVSLPTRSVGGSENFDVGVKSLSSIADGGQ